MSNNLSARRGFSFIASIVLLFNWGFLFAQTPSGTEVTTRFIDFMRGTPVLDMSFVFKVNEDGKNEVSKLKCKLVLQGSAYKMVNENVEVYCDGKTKWIINIDAAEVTLMNNDASSVDAAENPLAFFSSLKEFYKFPQNCVEKVVNGKKGYMVNLIAAKGKNPPYPKISLTTEIDGGRPLLIDFHAKNGYIYSVGSFEFIQGKSLLKIEEFRPSAIRLKGLYINDLR